MKKLLGIVVLGLLLSGCSENESEANRKKSTIKLSCEIKKVPQLLATDLHFSQGGADVLSVGWDQDRQTLLLVCRSPRQNGTIFLYLPDDYLPIETACVGARYTYRWQSPIHQIKLSQAQQKVVQISVRFTKTSSE